MIACATTVGGGLSGKPLSMPKRALAPAVVAITEMTKATMSEWMGILRLNLGSENGPHALFSRKP
jgi:hypothetical protein